MVQQKQNQVLGRDARGPITAKRLAVVPWSLTTSAGPLSPVEAFGGRR